MTIILVLSLFVGFVVGQTPYNLSINVSSFGTISYGGNDFVSYSETDSDLIIDSPQARYYTTSSVPIRLSSGWADSVFWNIADGTKWIYPSDQSYNSETSVTLGNGEYALHIWASQGSNQVEKTVIFGVNLRNIGAVYATGGSNTEIQASINSASNGYAVYLPAGTFEFDSSSPWSKVNVPAGISIYGAPTLRDATGHIQDWEWSTVLTMPWDAPDWSNFFDYSGASSFVTRFTGIKLVGYREFDSSNTRSTRGAIYINGGESEYRIDHCYFRNTVGTAVLTLFRAKGVVDHSVFINDPVSIVGVWADDTAHYAINTIGPDTWLPLSDVVGKYNQRDWYIENNYFKGFEVCVQTNHAGHYVFRYNYVKNGMAGVSLHVNLEDGMGGRLSEVYGNTFSYLDFVTNNIKAIKANCGTIISTENTFLNFGAPPDPYDWNAAIHLVQSSPFEWSHIQDSYIWSNTLSPSNSDLLTIKYGTDITDTIDLNEDYFLRAPSIALDGWVYVPYTYPHPLIDEK